MKTTYPYTGSKGEKYTVTVTTREDTPQVRVTCTCPMFKYGRWQECWHGRDVIAKHQLFTAFGCELYNFNPAVHV